MGGEAEGAARRHGGVAVHHAAFGAEVLGLGAGSAGYPRARGRCQLDGGMLDVACGSLRVIETFAHVTEQRMGNFNAQNLANTA